MTTLHEAATKALEALEESDDYLADCDIPQDRKIRVVIDAAIDALREALATTAEYVPCYSKSILEMAQQDDLSNASKSEQLLASHDHALRAEFQRMKSALAQQGEPVAYMVYAKGSRKYMTLTFDVENVPMIYLGGEVVPLYAGAVPAPLAQQGDEYQRGFSDGMKEAPTGECWIRVIDEAMVGAHLGVADIADDYGTAKEKLNDLICWSVEADRDTAAPAAQPTCKQDLQVPTVKENLTIETEQERYVRMCPDIECGRKKQCTRMVGVSCMSRADIGTHGIGADK